MIAPFRHFAKLAVSPPPPVPERLTRLERRRLSDAALDERRRAEVDYLSALLVFTQRQRECMKQVLLQMDRMRAARPGAQESMYFIGPTGTGKSTAVLRAAIRHHNDVLARFGQEGIADPVLKVEGWTHDLIPVIWVNVRADAKGKSVSGHILSALMEDDPRGTGAELANRLPKILPLHETSLVVLDDTHNLGTGGAETDRILKTVKNLQSDLGMHRIAFVYIGNPDKDTGEYNLTLHDQLAQRLVPFVLDPFDFDLQAGDDPPQNLAWAAYLTEWEDALMPLLPDLEPGEIASRLGRRLWNKTHGSPGGVIGVLQRHVQEVLYEDSPRRLSIDRDGLLATPVTMKYLRPVVSVG